MLAKQARNLGRCAIVSLFGATIFAAAPQGTDDGQWRVYGGTLGSKYSPLDQINRDNFADLQVAWRWVSVDGFCKTTTAGGDCAPATRWSNNSLRKP